MTSSLYVTYDEDEFKELLDIKNGLEEKMSWKEFIKFTIKYWYSNAKKHRN